MANTLLTFTYLAASILFILAIRGLASPETARKGNLLGIGGMLLAVGATIFRLMFQTICQSLLPLSAAVSLAFTLP